MDSQRGLCCGGSKHQDMAFLVGFTVWYAIRDPKSITALLVGMECFITILGVGIDPMCTEVGAALRPTTRADQPLGRISFFFFPLKKSFLLIYFHFI